MASFWAQPSQFGSSGAQPTSNVFGQSTQQQKPNLFSQSTQQQQQAAQQAPVFNLLTQSTTQVPQPAFGGSILAQSVQPLPRLGQSALGDSAFRPSGLQPRRIIFDYSGMFLSYAKHCAGEKPVPEQIELLFKKWNPSDPDCAFQEYLYNQAPADSAQFFHPGPSDDERKWEEALQKKPDPNAIPFNIRGFWELGLRMKMQDKALEALRLRMHEINTALGALKEKDELQLEIRAQKAKQRHIALSRRVLRLAATVQTMRNRGYAMDGMEERLKIELEKLQKVSFSPVLAGRQEEVWARLVVLRERANIMQEEFKKLGITATAGPELSDEQQELLKRVCLLLLFGFENIH